MAVPESAESISVLQNSTDPSHQITTLRSLKNLCIGHAEAKESLVQLGILQTLPHVISNASRSKGKHRNVETNGTNNIGQSLGWVEEDDVRVQAIALVGTFANGA